MRLTLLILFLLQQSLLVISAEENEDGCEENVDITDGVRVGTNITKDGVTYTQNDYFTSGVTVRGCICKVKKCVRKCCLDGESLNLTKNECVSEVDGAFTDFSSYHIIVVPPNQLCEEQTEKIMLDKKEDGFELVDGVLVLEDDFEFAMKDFCLSKMDGENVTVVVCVQNETGISGIFASAGMIISMPFLLMTLLVYAILPETSLHRKALMCYVSSLLIGYMILVSTQLSGPIPTVLCHVLGYSIIFFFTVSFFWMNVMCLDMWWAFSGMRAYNGFRGSEMKRFLFYCLYAFGIPSVHVFFVFMLNTYGDKNAYYHPLLGEKKCYVEDGLPELLYFYLPMAFVIIVNIVLFILTTIKIRKVKRETAMLKHSDSKRHSYEDDKQKFQLYLKLLLAMGVNWSMEVISWAVTWKLTKAPTWIWYLTDFTNATYGAVIFFIFVFKKKIWISLKKRYYVWVGKPHLAHAMSRSTPGTRTSQFSTTDTGYDHRMSELKNTKEEERALN